MVRLKNGNEQESRAAPVQNVKQRLLTWMAVFILSVSTVITFILCSNSTNVYGYGVTEKPAKKYYPDAKDNYFYVRLAGQSGNTVSQIKIGVTGPKTGKIDSDKTETLTNRQDFVARSRTVTLQALENQGNAYAGKLLDTSVSTTPIDPKAKEKVYMIISFRVQWKLPAHNQWSPNTASNKNPVVDIPAERGRFNCTYTGLSHSTKDTTFIATYEVNLSNTGLVVSGTDGCRYYGTSYKTKLCKKSYDLTLKDPLNGDTTTTHTCGTSVSLNQNRTTKGYKFNGWVDEDGKAVTSVDVCSKDRTVTAKWTAYKHNVVYDLQGGSFPSAQKGQTSLNGCKMIPNGVYYMRSDMGTNMYMHVYGSNYEPQKDPATVIYNGKGGSTQAQWIFERYKDTQYYFIISLYNGLALSLDGTPPANLKDKSVELWSQSVGTTADDFLWYLIDEGNGKVSICNKATKQSLDVKSGGTTNNTWIRQYNPNHQAAQRWTLETASQKDYPDRMRYGDHRLFVNTVAPEKEGSQFTCWNTKPDGTGTSYDPGVVYSAIRTDGNTVTLYAIWDMDDFTVSFNGNAGTGKMASVTHTANEAYTLPANTFTRKGYEFIGWALEPYTDGISYKDRGTYGNHSMYATLYAQWKKTGTGFIQRPFLDSNMFYKATSILGENKTTYNKDKVDSRMAHIDTAADPGYFSLLK